MKTALQQYIDRLEEMLQAATEKGTYWQDKGGPWQSHYNTTVNTLRNTITEAQQYLVIDRQIIEDAYNEGYESALTRRHDRISDGIYYYNQTFTDKNKQDDNN